MAKPEPAMPEVAAQGTVGCAALIRGYAQGGGGDDTSSEGR